MQFWIGLALVIIPVVLGLIVLLAHAIDFVFWPRWLQILGHPAAGVLGIVALAVGITLMITSC